MSLSKEDLQTLSTNSLSMAEARLLAKQLNKDRTAGGVFPNGALGDFSNPNVEVFKAKWCKAWPVVKKLLQIAKIFTPDLVDRLIDALIALGDANCGN